MSDGSSARLSFPLLRAGQAQKEMTHNEALTIADLLIQASVVAAGIAAPPTSPLRGDCWIVGTGASGAWAGADNSLAGWTDGGWRFVAPREGMSVWSIADEVSWTWRDGAWRAGEVRGVKVVVEGQQVAGPRQPAIASPGGGATVDGEARTTIGAILSCLRTHGLIAS